MRTEEDIRQLITHFETKINEWEEWIKGGDLSSTGIQYTQEAIEDSKNKIKTLKWVINEAHIIT